MSDSFGAPWTAARQAPLSMGLPRQEYWSGLLFPSPRLSLTQGLNLHLLHWQVEDSLPLSHLGSQDLVLSLSRWFGWLCPGFTFGTLNPEQTSAVSHSVWTWGKGLSFINRTSYMNWDRCHGLLRPDPSFLRWKEHHLPGPIAGTECGIVHSQALCLGWYYASISKCSHARWRFFGPPGTTWSIPEWRWLYKANSPVPKTPPGPQ